MDQRGEKRSEKTTQMSKRNEIGRSVEWRIVGDALMLAAPSPGSGIIRDLFPM
jgi:hypothetical protein